MSKQSKNEKLTTIIDAVKELKALNIVVLDLATLTSFTDYFVVATGTSDRHAKAISDNVVKELKQFNEPPLGVEGYDHAGWVLIDCGDIVVHIFKEAEREFYDIEKIWADAVRTEIT